MNYISMPLEADPKVVPANLSDLLEDDGSVSRLQFRSTVFEAYPGERKQGVSAVHRKRALSFLCLKMHECGYVLRGATYEMWGWNIELSHEGVKFSIGFGAYGPWSDQFLCVVEWPKPRVRKWLRRVSTASLVAKISSDIESIMSTSPEILEYHWLSEQTRAAA